MWGRDSRGLYPPLPDALSHRSCPPASCAVLLMPSISIFLGPLIRPGDRTS